MTTLQTNQDPDSYLPGLEKVKDDISETLKNTQFHHEAALETDSRVGAILNEAYIKTKHEANQTRVRNLAAGCEARADKLVQEGKIKEGKDEIAAGYKDGLFPLPKFNALNKSADEKGDYYAAMDDINTDPEMAGWLLEDKKNGAPVNYPNLPEGKRSELINHAKSLLTAKKTEGLAKFQLLHYNNQLTTDMIDNAVNVTGELEAKDGSALRASVERTKPLPPDYVAQYELEQDFDKVKAGRMTELEFRQKCNQDLKRMPPEQINKVITRLDDWKKNPDTVEKDPRFQIWEEAFKKTEDKVFKNSDPFKFMSRASDVKSGMREYIKTHPDATQADIQKESETMTKDIIAGMSLEGHRVKWGSAAPNRAPA
jgi:hypothetical protein